MLKKLAKVFGALALVGWLGQSSLANAADKRAKLSERTVEIKVTENGYEPSPLTVKKNQPLKLLITRVSDETCATEILIPEHKIETALPLNQQVEVRFTPKKAGTLKYGCAMGMMVSGVFKVE